MFSTLLSRRALVGLIVILGAALSLIAWHQAKREETGTIHARFLRRAQAQASLARGQLRTYAEMLYGLRSAFIGSKNVTRTEFSNVARDSLARHAGVQALEWIQIIADENRAALEAKASLELGRPFVVKRRAPDGTLIPAPRAPSYRVLLYIEPLAGNEAALGYDVSSAPIAEEVEASLRDRELKVSHPFRLAQATGPEDESGIAFILPVYDAGLPAAPVRGFVQGIFRVETMLAQAHRGANNEGLRSFYLDRASGQSSPALLYANLAGEEPLQKNLPIKLPEAGNPANHTETIALGNRVWTLVIAMDPTWARLQATAQPATVLGAGLAITALLALLVNNLFQRTVRVEREVTARTTQLRESEARLQSILDHSPAPIFVKDLEGRYVLFNRQFEKLCGRPRARLAGCRDAELFPPAQAEAFAANDQRVLSAGQPLKFEETSAREGKILTSLVHKFPLLDARGQPYALCGIATDITDRKQAELELAESRRQLDNLISQLPGAAFQCRFDKNLTALFVSEGMLQLTGFPAGDFVSGKVQLAGLTHPDDRAFVRAAIATGLAERRAIETEHRIVHRDGRTRWLLVRGRPVEDENGILRFLEGLAIDVTARKHAEAEKLALERNLFEAQKLESLGVLAGGVAHDFNNLLTVILGHASLMRLEMAAADPTRASVEKIENAARRAGDLCTQMLAYAGKGKSSDSRIDLTSLVRDTASLLEVSVRRNCSLDLQLEDGLPPVQGDVTQLRQVVMNLVTNGSDAIGDRRDGVIAIRTFGIQAESSLFRSALHQPRLASGRYVALEVRDNGSGMSAESMGRIFEPFFTTKSSGRGLGLSAVLGIVQGHKGALFLESRPGHGAMFRLLLPAADGKADATPDAPRDAPARPLSGTILIADDEETVRTMVGKVLRQNGATVLLAADGAQVLELYHRHRDSIDVILLDLTMPGLTGEQILLQLRQLKATQKIVIMSGYGEDETMRQCAGLGVTGFVGKPFEINTLVAKLRSMLG